MSLRMDAASLTYTESTRDLGSWILGTRYARSSAKRLLITGDVAIDA